MLTDRLPNQRTDLVVAPHPIEVVLADDGLAPLAIVLPPLEDMREMRVLGRLHFSLKEFAAVQWERLKSAFSGELEILQQKEARFGDSPTFFNRLANLAELAGDRGREQQYLNRMRALADDVFAAHRIGENLIAQNRIDDAEKLFASLDLKSDSYANLRLAFFHVHRKDLESALGAAQNAVSIDPLDFGARLFEGALHLVRGEYELAIQSFRIAAEEKQTSSPLFVNMALAYIHLGRTEKALRALRKAVALDPWNENAVSLLADYAFSSGRNEDAVPSLRYYLEYEQKNASMWARLARALIEIGESNDAIAALKRQGSIDNSPAVWNNLGVAYHRRNDRKKAYESFKYAMKLAVKKSPAYDLLLAGRNIASMLAEDRQYKDLLAFSIALFADDKDELLSRDRDLSDVYVFYGHALAHTGATQEAAKLAESVLSNKEAAQKLTAWMVTSLIAQYALADETKHRALELVNKYEHLLVDLGTQEPQRRDMLANNIAFALLETGQVDKAYKYLALLSHAFHNEPYCTATLGLFHLRKGHIGRAERLYEEAIGLAKTDADKARIRQKLNLELALYYIDSEPSRARRLLQKVAEGKAVAQFSERALALLKALPNKKSDA
jgi:tetratricopeptide (TPR) repeat protein